MDNITNIPAARVPVLDPATDLMSREWYRFFFNQFTITQNTGGGGGVTTFTCGTTGLTPSAVTAGAVSLAGVVNVAHGGTSLATLTANNVMLGNGTSAPTFVAPSTAGNVLTSNGTTWTSAAGGAGSGTVTSVSVVTANGVSGTVATATTTPAITLTLAKTGTSTTYVTDTSPTLITPALGTPTALVATNATGTASGLTAGTVTTNANLTGVITSVGNATSIASQTGTGSKFVVDTSPTLITPNLGTPSALVGTNITGTGASFTAGLVTNGVYLATTQTLTNKWIQPRFLASTANSATPTLNTDSYDMMVITNQSAAITSFTTNLTGTPVNGQKLWISITGTGAIAITWGASFSASTIALPTTTVTTARLDVGFVWNVATTTWRCVASA